MNRPGVYRLLASAARVAFAFVTASALTNGSETYPPPRFTDTQRISKLESAFANIDKIFHVYAASRNIPGMVWGVVIDGRVAHVSAVGVRDRNANAPVTASTVFRIASMTKSFTALAILKLRDEGKLSLEDPVSKWIPEFARMEMPTRDAGPIRVRHLLTHGAGFPEDNPWGDQQLGASDAQLTAWLKQGIPFSTVPDMQYEYSNYGFGLLGRIIERASGVPYQEYVRAQILRPLQMTVSTVEPSQVPAASKAIGYRRTPDGAYLEEPPLPHGAFGAMGGLLTSANDLGRYVSFQLAAWPPRDDAETGPVRRSSVREMNQLWRLSTLSAGRTDGKLRAEVRGYGYGLRVAADCRFDRIVTHSGGLPGFGSHMAWLPEYGVGMFAMANLTYVGPSQPVSEAWDVLLKTGGLRKRELPATPLLTDTRDHIVKLWRSWNDKDANEIAAMNLFLDEPVAQRRQQIDKLKTDVGECSAVGPVRPENWLRGQFNMTCNNGQIGVFFSLAPIKPPKVQFLSFQKIATSATRVTAPTSSVPGVTCSE
jgi:CubicO group peptidase (beta-lactamase class C family)